MTGIAQLIVFRLTEQRYALPLDVAERVVRAVEITPLPSAPAIVLGVIDVAGRVLPVLNVRRRFRLPNQEIQPSDQFLIARTDGRAVALAVDEVQGIIERLEAEIVGPALIVPGLEHVRGVLRLHDGLVLIHDLEGFLSLGEARALDQAMNEEVVRED